MTDAYAALTQGAGLLERVDRGRLRLTGADRKSYLQGLLTNDIVALSPGTGCYAAMLTAQGRMIADMRVLDTGEAIVLDVDASLAGMLRERFEQFIFTEDVTVADVSEAIAQLAIHGPDSPAAVARALADAARDRTALAARLVSLPPVHHVAVPTSGTPVLAAASDEFGVPGFDLYGPRQMLAAVRQRLEDEGVVQVDLAAADVLRIEAGHPAFLRDMTEDTIPLEAGIDARAISYTKGCYVGQEIIIRVQHRGGGRVARRLVGLLVEGAVPSPADAIRAGDRQIGSVTSAAHSPALDRPIALGYVHRDFTAPGTEVTVAHGGALLAARVAALPLVTRQVASPPA